MQMKFITSVLFGTALALGPCLTAQSTGEGPSFSISGSNFDSNIPPFAINDEDSLVLKQVVAPPPTGGVQPAAYIIPALIAPQSGPPCLFTLTLTKYGDDSGLVSTIQGCSNPAGTEVVITFTGLAPTLDGNGNGTRASSYSVTPDGLQSIYVLNQPNDCDEDFDSIDDIGMEKIKMTFKSITITPITPSQGGTTNS